MSTPRLNRKPEPMGAIMPMPEAALLRLLQLTSPALPIGAYSWSQGLESAIDLGWVHDQASCLQWLSGVLDYGLGRLDIPLLARLYHAWEAQQPAAVQQWTEYLYSARETQELRQEDQQLGRALARLLCDLGLSAAEPWRRTHPPTLATLFSLAAVEWQIPLAQAAQGYAWSWCENQIAAAGKLVPLGQTAGQRVLSALQPTLLRAVAEGLQREDAQLSGSLPGLALASARHETQYSRLFRS